MSGEPIITIRLERADDIAVIHKINEEAFGQSVEADLVDILRDACPDAISLVAISEDRIVGHILFTPVTIISAEETIRGVGLGPMAVLPEHQRQGIGTLLVEEGLEIVREQKSSFVIVLGHPDYYPRFGFVPASRHGIACQWDGVPDEAFMALILDKKAMEGVSGTARYREEFEEAM